MPANTSALNLDWRTNPYDRFLLLLAPFATDPGWADFKSSPSVTGDEDMTRQPTPLLLAIESFSFGGELAAEVGALLQQGGLPGAAGGSGQVARLFSGAQALGVEALLEIVLAEQVIKIG